MEHQRLTEQMKIEASQHNNSYLKLSNWQIQWKLPRTHTQPGEDAHGSLWWWLVYASLFHRANPLLFTPCTTTYAPFNLHCCSRSMFQSAVVLIASPWWSQLPLLNATPEKCCASLNEENRQDAIEGERERDSNTDDERQGEVTSYCKRVTQGVSVWAPGHRCNIVLIYFQSILQVTSP